MCADPNAAKEIAAIKTEIENLEGRVSDLEQLMTGDGSKEKGVIPRLSAIETKMNLLLWLLGAAVTTLLPAVCKYLFFGGH